MSIRRRILGISDSKAVFVPAWRAPEYFELMVRLTGKARPNACYIGAAKGDNPERIGAFFELANRVGCSPSALRLFSMTTENPDAYFSNSDLIFIDGGVTRNLVALMREWNVIEPLLKAYERGALIVGASAGISMLFDWCVSDSVRTKMLPVRGIGLLKGAVCAHYDVSSERRSVLHGMMQDDRYNALPAYGLEDGVSVLFEDESIVKVYAASEKGKAYIFHDRASLNAPQIRFGDQIQKSFV